MRLSLLLALTFGVAAWGFVPPAQTLYLVQAEEDEEEEDTPPKPADPKPTETKPAETKPAEAAPEPAAATQPAKLVSGAPLGNPNVGVHIVQKKSFSDKGRFEVVLFPAVAQANGKFTQHYGTALSGVWHVHENFGFQLTGQYNWFASESAFNGELIQKARIEAQAATSLLLVWGAQAGVEVSPLYGKFAWYEDSLAHFSFVITGGAGIGATRHQLKPASEQSGPATFGETGNKFLGSLGAGFRLQVGQRYAFRLELRDLVYTARVDQVNGCDSVDLAAMDAALRAGQNHLNVNTAPSCQKEKFQTTDVPLAKNLVATPSSDVLNNVGVYAGFAFLF